MTSIAQGLGIDVHMLYRWRRESKKAAADKTAAAFPGCRNAWKEELVRLRKENAELRETNEILKKAMVIFIEGKPR